MNLPESSRLQFTLDLNIYRLLNGMWQVSGAYGRIDRTAIQSIFNYMACRVHDEDNALVFSFTLDAEDYNQISAVLRRSQNLYQLIFNCRITFETGYTKSLFWDKSYR